MKLKKTKHVTELKKNGYKPYKLKLCQNSYIKIVKEKNSKAQIVTKLKN